ncbi:MULTISPECIES: HAMP domain-containing sensor histidine kinase [unclassified Enterococcus]|uniref:sensor histidine kinase n=1 Tax=unclassified Enterococcus TaxID=2608891 RepID=UPI001554C8E6|nr:MULTISPECIES: HAMP domain-containing sensor histidine kinase [unclassified Enterococcus]MBS7576352.1 HAMP domain-containing histidine kinase [Enterococcus sp. MMGLQ5-2]MBS7583584.1 HAMP domain-containing histidine kinase [Enterococcus sp. MMGLQ5-1]NPD11446.1 HAMP domain-containing histidine kinase [Enterococcus sp. MMGLQ5-1]NPD36190.1 HAMP domain-containing histidine kinase [Enterococcus sp. MMGLQ5-2]
MKYKSLLITIFYLIIGSLLIFSIRIINLNNQSNNIEKRLIALEEVVEKQDFSQLDNFSLLEANGQTIQILNKDLKQIFPATNQTINTEDIRNLKKGSYITRKITNQDITYSTKIIKNNQTIGYLRLSELKNNISGIQTAIIITLLLLYLIYWINELLTRRRNRLNIQAIVESDRKKGLMLDKQDTEPLLQTEQRITSFIELSDTLLLPSFIYNQKGKIVHANKKVLETFPQFFPAIDYFSAEAEFLNLLVNQLIKPEHIHRQMNFDKVNRFFKITIFPIDAANFFVLLEDQTDIIELIEKQNEFSANIAHELKTPTASIIGFSENLLEGIEDPDDIKHFAAIINHEAERLNQLISDIISLSKSHQHINNSEIQLPELVNSILSDYKKTIEKKQITVNISKEHFIIRSKERLLQLIFKNLIENALYYTENNGQVNIQLSMKQNMLTFQICDSGIGISELNQRKIFDRFFRVDNTKSKNNKGTGLGLSIVKSYVTELGGSIQVQSELGEGTSFEVLIPVR